MAKSDMIELEGTVVEALPKAYEGKSIGGIDFGKIYEQFR